MATIQKIYSDIDYTFTRKPVTADVALSYDTQAVVRSVRNLLLTKPYERLFNSDLGSHISSVLFEPISPSSSALIEVEVRRTLQNYEPRVTLKTINVIGMDDKNAYEVTLTFFIENDTQPTTITLLLERTR